MNVTRVVWDTQIEDRVVTARFFSVSPRPGPAAAVHTAQTTAVPAAAVDEPAAQEPAVEEVAAQEVVAEEPAAGENVEIAAEADAETIGTGAQAKVVRAQRRKGPRATTESVDVK